MSFAACRRYPQHILAPIAYSPNHDQIPERPLPTPPQLLAWESTAHYFVGTTNRVNPLSWPWSRFEEDPSKIPDDASFNIHYKTRDGACENDEYRVFEKISQSRTTGEVLPSILVRRYIPKSDGSSSTCARPRITLLMLAGMGLPKEVRSWTVNQWLHVSRAD